MIALGANDDVIHAAEQKLGVVFPEILRRFYGLSNGIDIPQWRIYSVFDPSNPRKSANHIVHENTFSRWSYMPEDLVCLGGNGTGDQLVLKKSGETLESEIYIWDHETNEIERWSHDLEFLVTAAQKRIAEIEKQVQKAKRTN